MKHILYLNHSQKSNPERRKELKEMIEYSDKEMLIQIIEALMDNNETLQKYVEALEKRYLA